MGCKQSTKAKNTARESLKKQSPRKKDDGTSTSDTILQELGWKNSTKAQESPKRQSPRKKDDDTLISEPWYFGELLVKSEWEKLLLTLGKRGSFLISKDKTDGKYVLSVKEQDSDIKHYDIRTNTSGTRYYINKNLQFPTLQKLVQYYKNNTAGDDGLTIHLNRPCAGEEFQARRDSVQLVSILGMWQCAEVWQGLWNGTTEVAVKVFQHKLSFRIVDSLLIDAQALKKLRHPRLVEFYAVCTKQEPMYIISELMPRGSLLDYLRGDVKSCKLPQLITFAEQIANGMAYLEMKRYVHGDLAAKNVLMKNENDIKIANFGLWRLIDDTFSLEENIPKIYRFPLKWMAPETITHLYGKCTTKSDVWSYGILLYEVMTHGGTPYEGGGFEKMFEGNYRMPCPKGCPEQVYEVMQDCWKREPEERPSFQSLQITFEEFLTFKSFRPERETPSSE